MATATVSQKSGFTSRVKRLIDNPAGVLNGRFREAAGGESRPAFYDIDQIHPGLRLLDRNYPVIREEMEAVLKYKDRIPRYHDLSEKERYISGTVDPFGCRAELFYRKEGRRLSRREKPHFS